MILQIAMFISTITYGMNFIYRAKIIKEFLARTNSYAAQALEEACVINKFFMLVISLQFNGILIFIYFNVFMLATNK